MRAFIAAGAVAAALAVAPAASAEDNGAGRKKSTAPSRNALADSAPVTGAGNATPFAWIDDATVLAPGAMSCSISAMRWHNADASEADLPIVDAAVGLTRRVQLAASVPRVLDGADAAGGMGTSFFSTKVALYDGGRRRHALKVAAAPTLQVMGEGVATTLGPGEGRARWGLPVTAEITHGAMRLYGGSGYFSPGLWFAGAAAAARASDKTIVSVGFSRAWRSAEAPGAPLSARDRKELSVGAAYGWTRTATLFGTLGRSVATLDENGAGVSISGGLSVAFAPPRR
jgi:hypothetical protein